MLSAQNQQTKSVMTKSSLFTVLSNLIDADYQQGSTYSGEPISITLMDSNDNENEDIDLAVLINPDDELQLVVRFVNTDIDEAHSWVESLLNQIGLENNCEIIDEGDDTDNTITAIFILDDFSDVANTEVQETDAENNINTLDLVTNIDKINEAENILQNIVTTNNINFNSDGVIETNNTNFNDVIDNDSSDNNDNSNDDNNNGGDDNNNNSNNDEKISTKEKISINNEINDTNEQLQKNINSEQSQFEQSQIEQNQIDSEGDNLQNEILQSDSNMNNLEINNTEEQDNNKDVEEQNSNEEQNNDENEDEDESIEINEELRKAMSSINPNINMYYSMPTNNESTNSTSTKKVVADLETKNNINTNDNNSDINNNVDFEVEIIDSDNNIKKEENNENMIIASNEKIIIANNNNNPVIPTAIPAIPSASSMSINSVVASSSSSSSSFTPLASTQVKVKTKTKSTRKSKIANQQQTNLNNVTMTATSVTPTVMGMSIKGLSNRVSATTADGRILSAAGQVKEMLDEITANNTMTTALLANLQDVAICKDKMKLSYPLLMKVNPNMAYKDQALFNGKKRYGKRIITYCGENFYVTNHIFVANVSKIRSYLESLNLIKKSTYSVTVTNSATLKQQAIQNLINQKTGITSAAPLAVPTDITASTLQQVNSSTSNSNSNSTDIQSQS